MKEILTFLGLMVLSLSSYGQEERPLLREGNRLYQSGDYKSADSLYMEAIGKASDNPIAYFNRGNALYRDEQFEDAAKEFQYLAKTAESDQLKEKAFHNLGNSQMQQGKLQEAIQAYKEALKINPNANASRKNLMTAKAMLKEQEKQQQENSDQQDQQEDNQEDQGKDKDESKDDNGDDSSDKSKDDTQKDGENKDEQSKGDGDNTSDSKDKESNENPEQKGENGKEKDQKQEGISKADAQRLLEALKNKEGALQRVLMQGKGEGKNDKKIEKDW